MKSIGSTKTNLPRSKPSREKGTVIQEPKLQEAMEDKVTAIYKDEDLRADRG